MTDVMELRRSNLVLPEGFVPMDEEEMCYVEGGGFSTSVAAAIIDVALLVFTSVVNIALNGLKIFGKSVIKGFIKNNAAKWATSLRNISIFSTAIQGIGGNAGTVLSMFDNISPWVDRLVTACSIGGIIATVYDIADGSWNGYIG